jgi:hypothetical protein
MLQDTDPLGVPSTVPQEALGTAHRALVMAHLALMEVPPDTANRLTAVPTPHTEAPVQHTGDPIRPMVVQTQDTGQGPDMDQRLDMETITLPTTATLRVPLRTAELPPPSRLLRSHPWTDSPPPYLYRGVCNVCRVLCVACMVHIV